MEIIASGKLGDSPNKAGAKRAVAKHKAKACSSVTNGRDILPGADGRSLIARRYHDIQVALVIDQGGPDRISEARLQLIRRFSAACIAEDLEAKLARGEEIDIGEHALKRPVPQRLCGGSIPGMPRTARLKTF